METISLIVVIFIFFICAILVVGAAYGALLIGQLREKKRLQASITKTLESADQQKDSFLAPFERFMQEELHLSVEQRNSRSAAFHTAYRTVLQHILDNYILNRFDALEQTPSLIQALCAQIWDLKAEPAADNAAPQESPPDSESPASPLPQEASSPTSSESAAPADPAPAEAPSTQTPESGHASTH